MITSTVDAHVHYRHNSTEVEELAKAIVPLHDNIVAVSSGNERGNMRRILNGQYFRRRDVISMRFMLIRAVKHAKANLADYFPMMRAIRLQEAQNLEDAVTAYWTQFASEATQTTPTH
jgi:hypothetical protein